MKFWLDKEIKYLIKNYKALKYKEIASKLGKTESAIWGKCHQIGLTKDRSFCDKKGIIKELRRRAVILNHSPSTSEVDTTLLSKCRRCFGSLNKAKEKAGLKKRLNLHILPRIARNPSAKLAYITGLLIGDGSFRFQGTKNRKSYVIIFGSKDKDLMDYFVSQFTDWSQYKPIISVIKNNYHRFPNGKTSFCQKFYITQICFKEAWALLKNFKEKPLLCLKFFRREHRRFLLKGLWDAEGGIYLHGINNLRIHFVNGEHSVLKLYKELLNEFGFNYSIYNRENGTKDICIYKPVESLKFIQKINGVTIKRKMNGQIIEVINFLKKENRCFSDRVYDIVKGIKIGEVMTYADVAKKAGKPKAWRAVGNILNKNKNPKIPCHRVIKSNGKIGGYNKGLKQKTRLLKEEGFLVF